MVDSFILDDRSEGVTGTGWFAGSYKYCEDANGGGLSWHHDDGQNKGRVSAIYSLSGRNTSGCFAVSEWHPGGESCSRYLPRRVPITLTHGSPADPIVTHVFVDQSRNGGGWNLLGFFYFAQGFGQVVSSNAGTDQCDRSVCYWVTDAFKFERAPSDACLANPPPPPAGPRPDASARACCDPTMAERFGGSRIVTLLSCLVVFAMIALLARRWLRRRRRAAGGGTSGGAGGGGGGGSGGGGGGGATELELSTAVAALPTASCGAGETGEDCAICLCAFAEGEKATTLPCGHRYHTACIETWLLGRGRGGQGPNMCPLCKAPVVIVIGSGDASRLGRVRGLALPTASRRVMLAAAPSVRAGSDAGGAAV